MSCNLRIDRLRLSDFIISFLIVTLNSSRFSFLCWSKWRTECPRNNLDHSWKTVPNRNRHRNIADIREVLNELNNFKFYLYMTVGRKEAFSTLKLKTWSRCLQRILKKIEISRYPFLPCLSSGFTAVDFSLHSIWFTVMYHWANENVPSLNVNLISSVNFCTSNGTYTTNSTLDIIVTKIKSYSLSNIVRATVYICGLFILLIQFLEHNIKIFTGYSLVKQTIQSTISPQHKQLWPLEYSTDCNYSSFTMVLIDRSAEVEGNAINC